ncbi:MULTISPECIES: hypothetical protein [Pseudoalteromonas]|nr:MULTISPECIES: hypothetical protein [Pseudoalteromonas]MDK1312941.1 hypothetical protein [Pseudoalteromonas sp. R96]
MKLSLKKQNLKNLNKQEQLLLKETRQIVGGGWNTQTGCYEQGCQYR